MNRAPEDSFASKVAVDGAWAIWFVTIVVAWYGLLGATYLVAIHSESGLAKFFGDPAVNGVLQWVGTGLTLGGFGIAWIELRRIKTAAEAAAAAVDEARSQFDARTTISLLQDAIDYLQTAWKAVDRADWSMAEFSVRLCLKALIRLEMADKAFDQYPGLRAAVQESSYGLTAEPGPLSAIDAKSVVDSVSSASDALQKRLEEIISTFALG